MQRHIKRALGFAALVLVVATSAEAQGKGKGKDKSRVEKAKHGTVRTSDGTVILDDRRRRDDRDDRNRDDRNRDDRNRDDRDRDVRIDRGVRRNVPPGLAKKPGQMPPGQYKKLYGTNDGATVLGDIMRRRGYSVVRIVPSGVSQYVYYRMPDGGIERRAIVSPGTDRLRFQNVPAALLQEVLARLY